MRRFYSINVIYLTNFKLTNSIWSCEASNISVYTSLERVGYNLFNQQPKQANQFMVCLKDFFYSQFLYSIWYSSQGCQFDKFSRHFAEFIVTCLHQVGKNICQMFISQGTNITKGNFRRNIVLLWYCSKVFICFVSFILVKHFCLKYY